MTKSDRIIADLVNALDAIATATKSEQPYALAFIRGIAEQAQRNANAYRTMNTDGYLVVKES